MFNSVNLPPIIPALNKDSDGKFVFECLLAPSALTVLVVSGDPLGPPTDEALRAGRSLGPDGPASPPAGRPALRHQAFGPTAGFY